MEIKKNLKIMFPFFFTYLFTCYAALKNSNFNYELINRDLFNNSRGNIIFDLNCTDKIINQFIFNVNVYDLENMDLLKSTDIVCAKNTGVINLPKKKLLLLLKSLNSNIRIKQKVFLYEIKEKIEIISGIIEIPEKSAVQEYTDILHAFLVILYLKLLIFITYNQPKKKVKFARTKLKEFKLSIRTVRKLTPIDENLKKAIEIDSTLLFLNLASDQWRYYFDNFVYTN